MKKVIFIKDFATKSKGDIYECTSIQANRLTSAKVAKPYVKVLRKKSK